MNLKRKKKITLIQNESTCIRQNNSDLKIEICVGESRKHCGKRRKCWLPAASPFPTIFLKAFFSRGVKSRDCVVKGEPIEICIFVANPRVFFVNLTLSQTTNFNSSKLKVFADDSLKFYEICRNYCKRVETRKGEIAHNE